MKHVHLAAGLAIANGRLLLVASRYANHPEPLWNLPGGRQQPGELLAETAARETLEETGLRATAGRLAYLSESYDTSGAEPVHFTSAVFHLTFDPAQASSAARQERDDHVTDVQWVPVGEIGARIVVPVVRDPLLACLSGRLPQAYAGYRDAGITIRWPSGSS